MLAKITNNIKTAKSERWNYQTAQYWNVRLSFGCIGTGVCFRTLFALWSISPSSLLWRWAMGWGCGFSMSRCPHLSLLLWWASDVSSLPVLAISAVWARQTGSWHCLLLVNRRQRSKLARGVEDTIGLSYKLIIFSLYFGDFYDRDLSLPEIREFSDCFYIVLIYRDLWMECKDNGIRKSLLMPVSTFFSR